MKYFFAIFVVAATLVLGAWAVPVWAADIGPFSRQQFDQIMRYVNFIILAALVIKYARRPIINFLKDKRQEVASVIQRLESQKRQIETQIRDSQIQLSAGQQRLELIKGKIISEGQNRKSQLIADAQKEARILMDNARARIETRILDAQSLLRRELVDMAADIAAGKLPSLVTATDEERLLQQWFDRAADDRPGH